MRGEGKIRASSFALLVMLYTIGSSILLSPSSLAFEAKQDAWMGAILGIGVGVAATSLYSRLGKYFPNMTLVEYSETILGKWLGKVISFLFICFFFIIASLILRNLGDFLTTQIMPETPIQFAEILFVVIVIMGVRLGLETLAGAAEIFFPWFILLLLILILFLIPEVDIKKIQPVFEEGIKPIIRASLPLMGFPFFELVVFSMFIPYVDKQDKVGKALVIGAGAGGFVLFILTFLSVLVLGPTATAGNAYPSYLLAKKINIANFITRIEAIMAIMWFITIFFKLSLAFYASILGLAQLVKLKEYRILTLPFSMILIVASLVLVPNTPYLIEFNESIWWLYSATYGLVFPTLLLVVAMLRKKV
ncbi:GerAB/ArcD/ProY family transporter [Aneurinibacillus uraniidurans]|uniref:GerAB/ArcD/ProY family transporter n=1 Tax=Aneurinibacillus uraniidurans TaxID=2966586 RepID=UPI00234B7583|nr:endospore germination permease [Aneurinibacillus sp. B1]WCN38282.1 endospore germination permease [Aneurinibacillus sp. B1]